jgi:hypothetical protein
MATNTYRITRVAGIVLVMLAGALQACTTPAATATAEATSAIAEAPTNTPEPSATPTEVPSPTAAPTATVCTYGATFIADVTVPDDTRIAPGAAFDKVWRVRSSGCAPWPDGTVLAFDHGDQLDAPNSVAVGAAAVGTDVDIHVPMIVPTTPGTYKGYWQFRAPDGTLFGQLDVLIVVPAPTAIIAPTATPVPTATSTHVPVPAKHSDGTIEIPETSTADLDSGAVPGASSSYDFLFQVVSPTEKYLTPQNGAKFAIWGTSEPGYHDCDNKDKSSDHIKLHDLPVGTYVCYRTSDDRIGEFRVNAISGSPTQTLKIAYTTWEKP